MKNTSRRTFGKQLTGAIAAMSVSTLTAKGDATQEQEKVQRPKPKTSQRTHDTPPPLEFINGSLVVESERAFDEEGPNTGNTRKEYRVAPSSGNAIFPAHIKIVDGSGEMLYRKDEADNCAISIELRDSAGSSTMVNGKSAVTSDAKIKFIVDVDKIQKLDLGDHVKKDKPSSKRRTRRYRHSAGDTFSMYEITIKDGNRILYSLSPRGLPLQGEDLKVMIWLESV